MDQRAFYYFEPYQGVPLVPWLERAEDGRFVRSCKDIPNPFRDVARAGTLAEAAAAWMPNNFRSLDPSAVSYIRSCVDQAQDAGIPVFLYSCGDLSDRLAFDDRAYVFRFSTYRSSKRAQDIVMPTLTQDLGASGILMRAKADRPTVSFCGQAGYKTPKEWARYYVKVAAFRMLELARPGASARIVGVYWRRRALAVFRASGLVLTNFILRRSFSGSAQTIELDPEQAHREFVASIRDSDFVLAPKGDGNYSNRLLEALSLGRIPVLIDTEYVSPYEEELDYESVMVRVPMNDVERIAERIRAWYDPLTEEAWQARQRNARDLYETYLRLDSFHSHFFERVLPTLPADARKYRAGVSPEPRRNSRT